MTSATGVFSLDADTGRFAVPLIEKDPRDSLFYEVDFGAWLDAHNLTLTGVDPSASPGLTLQNWQLTVAGSAIMARGARFRLSGGATGTVAYVGMLLHAVDPTGIPVQLALALPFRVSLHLPAGLLPITPQGVGTAAAGTITLGGVTVTVGGITITIGGS